MNDFGVQFILQKRTSTIKKQNTARNVFIVKSTYSPTGPFRRFCLFHYDIYFHQFTVHKQEKFQIHLYTILIQGINVIFTDQLPVFLVLKIVHTILKWKYSKYTIPTQKYGE